MAVFSANGSHFKTFGFNDRQPSRHDNLGAPSHFLALPGCSTLWRADPAIYACTAIAQLLHFAATAASKRPVMVGIVNMEQTHLTNRWRFAMTDDYFLSSLLPLVAVMMVLLVASMASDTAAAEPVEPPPVQSIIIDQR